MENIKFNIIDENNQTIECEIVSLIPDYENENNAYIIYTDFKDETKLLASHLVELEDGYIMERIDKPEIIDQLKKELSDDLLDAFGGDE